MPDVDDIILLREYADCNSDSAFAEIVHRHINLVYSVALRYVGNSPDAQDVTQAVFIILAQKAASLRQRTALTGWLYETTRFTAMNFLTSKTRRQAREQKAYMQSTLNDSNSENVWRQLAPLLEEAMTRLSEKERTLVALRFFENKSAAETATVLGIQEWAAHKRAARAMEKLRQFFVKRGIASTAAMIAGAISANSVQAAPTMLVETVTTAAFAKGAAASTSTLTLIKGALKIMAWTKAKTTIVTGIVVVLAAATAIVAVKVPHRSAAALKAQSDTTVLQGTWGGQEKGGAGGSTLTIEGSNIEFHDANPNQWYKATFTLREDTTPKQLIAVITDCPAPSYVGKTSYSIYQIQDSLFTFVGSEPGKPNPPTGFDAPGGRKFVFTKK